MALDRIEQLVEKYFDGETSIAEENELKVYFSTSDVAPHLKQYSSVFNYFSNAEKAQFETAIASLPKFRKNNKSKIWFSVAASIVVLLGVGTFLYFNTSNSNEFVGCNSEDNPEVVMQETQKALDLVSTHINTGIVSIGYINEYNDSKNKIFKK